MMRKRLVVVVAMGAMAGLGAALGAALAGSSSTSTRTVTVAGTATSPAHTVTQVRTVTQLRTHVKTVAVPGPAVPVGGVPARGQALFSRGPLRPQRFSGTGLRVLGTIIVGQPGATFHWTNSGGRFRLLFNDTGVAVDSTAQGGELGAPPLTYMDVTVVSRGHWTVRIG
jgi:hypothetical protein